MQTALLSAAFFERGIETYLVPKEDYLQPLGYLAGLDTKSLVQTYVGDPLPGPMAVFCGLDTRIDEILPVFRQCGAGAGCLKAVLTEHNRKWNALGLYQELSREHEEIRKTTAKKE